MASKFFSGLTNSLTEYLDLVKTLEVVIEASINMYLAD